MLKASKPIYYGDIVYIQYDNLVLMANGQYSPTLHLNSTENIAIKSWRNGLFMLYPSLMQKDIGKYNQKIIEEFKGKPIKYHQQVQLFHVESQSFVGVSDIFGQEDQSINPLLLTKSQSDKLYFGFISKADHQDKGIVEYGTPVSLVSSKSQSGLKLGMEIDKKPQINPETNKLTNESGDFPDIQPRRAEPIYQSEKVYRVGVTEKTENDGIFTVKKFISHQDQVKAESKKYLKNGDYIRIMNDKFYLNSVPKRKDPPHFFQAFSVNQEYKYHHVNTVFQIIDVSGEFDINALPCGNLLEFNENNRYMVKHFASGKFFTFKDGLLKIGSIDDDAANLSKISLSSTSEQQLESNYIDKSVNLQIKCYNEENKEEGILHLGDVIKLPNVQLEVNTWFFYGFVNQDNYLNKWTRPERFASKLSSESLGHSNFKFVKVADEEMCSIQLAEGFTNEMQRFVDFMSEFKYGAETESLKELNQWLVKVANVSSQYCQDLFNEGVLNNVRQTILREFRSLNLLYETLQFVIEDPEFKNKVNEVLDKQKVVKTDETEAEEAAHSEPKGEIEELNSVSLELAIRNIWKLIMNSFKKNDYNRFYCSQFVRVPINCLTKDKEGMTGLISDKERKQIKSYMLELCKQGLWDKDLDALGQLNFYEEPVFEAIGNQDTFHVYYIQLMQHISISKAPNLQNLIRDNMIFNFLSSEENMKHVFPKIREESGKVSLEFIRKGDQSIEKRVFLDNIEHGEETDELLEYFQESLRLILALNNIDSSMFKLKIMIYYPYEQLVAARKILEVDNNSSRFEELKILLSEVMNSIHQSYLSVPYLKLPKQIQIQDQGKLDQINNFIKGSIQKGITPSEKTHLTEQNAEQIVETVASLSGDQSVEFDKLVEDVVNLNINDLESSRIILEQIQKFLGSHTEMPFEFLNRSRRIIISLINEAIMDKSGKVSNDFIKQTLEVFGKIEKKTTAYVAAEITNEESKTSADNEKFMGSVQEWKRFLHGNEVYPMLLDIFLLKQYDMLSDVIQQMRKLSSFESNLHKELDKMVLVEGDVGPLEEVVKVTWRLNEISREVNFCKDNLIGIDQEKMTGFLNETLEGHWKLFFTIYDVSKHFEYPDEKYESCEKRFRDAFENAKKIRWDKPVYLRPEAINTSFQKIFKVLQTHDALFKSQYWILDKKSGFEEEFLVHGYIFRLNILLLLAFVRNNKENQLLCSTSRGFIRQYYNQHFLNQSPDTMMLFAEIFRNNKKLLKLPHKYLYDITMSTYVGTLSRSISNAETNSYLASTIMSFEFLARAHVPVELYNPLHDLKEKFGQVADCESFSSLDILGDTNEGDVFVQPYCYYSIRGILNAFLENYDYLAGSRKGVEELQSILTFEQWLKFFQDKNFFLQYELKNLIAQCFIKNYFNDTGCIIESKEECLKMMSSLLGEIHFYRKLVAKKNNQNSPELTRLTEAPSVITNNECYIKVNELQKEVVDLEMKKVEIFLEKVSLQNLFEEYIFGGCLEMILNLLVKYTELSNTDNESPSMAIATVLEILMEFIEFERSHEKLPFKKLEDLFKKASTSLEKYDNIRPIMIKFSSELYNIGLSKSTDTEITMNKNQEDQSLVDNKSYLESLKRRSKEQNIKQIAEYISKHPRNKDIIHEVMVYLRHDINQLDQEEIIFILRLLRKYIEIENTNNANDNPIYVWKQLDYMDLKRVESIQEYYRSLGLSQLIAILFSINDHRIFRETLLLSIAYMFGHNAEVQKDFDENFKAESENYIKRDQGEVVDSLIGFVRYKQSNLSMICSHSLEVCQHVVEFLSRDE